MLYLKRCNGKRLLVGFVAPTDSSKVEETNCTDTYFSTSEHLELLLEKHNFDMSIFENKFEIGEVPARPPKTKLQALNASKIWPINFHPDVTLERILDGTWFDSRDRRIIDRCMRLCIEAASLEASGNAECNGSAIIFDPTCGEIVAVAASQIHRHPMWHAAILAIDLVAGLRCSRTYGAYHQLAVVSPPVACSSSGGGGSKTRKRKYSISPLAYPFTLYDIVAPAKETLAASPTSPKIIDNQYLCTNYWVFLLCEPCPLCAMALLHSRVSDIFYACPNEYRGILGSRALLHTTSGLNHRFRVWNSICEEESRNILRDISQRRRPSS